MSGKTKKNNKMLNDYEIKVEIEKIKLWSCWLCERVCKLEELEDNEEEDVIPPTPPIEEEEDNNEEEEPPKEKPKLLLRAIGIGYGDKYVCCDGRFFYYSYDGNDWFRSPSYYTGFNFSHFAYGNRMYLMATSGTNIYYSEDGTNWGYKTISIESKTESGTYNPDVSVIKFCGDKFIGVSVGSTSSTPKLPIYSTDGINWFECKFENYDIFTNEWYEDIAYDGVNTVVVGNGTYKIAYTEDGVNWKAIKDVGSSGNAYIVYGNNKFVASWYNGDVWYAEHLDSWTKAEEQKYIIVLSYNGNVFTTYGCQSLTSWRFKSSYDGITWEMEDYALGTVPQYPQHHRYFDYMDKDVAVGNGYTARRYGSTWQIKGFYDGGIPRNVKYINGNYYMCCGQLMISMNGMNWDQLYYTE